MNRYNILGLCVTTVFGLSLLPGSAVSQTKSLKDQLVGTWIVASWEQVRGNEKIHRFGDNPKGINVFEANGRFVVMFTRPDLAKFAAPDPMKATPQEMKAVMEGSIAYFGTYTVDEATKVVDLKIESSTFPNQVGAPNKRTITSVSPSELKYQNTTVTSGGQIYVALKRAM